MNVSPRSLICRLLGHRAVVLSNYTGSWWECYRCGKRLS